MTHKFTKQETEELKQQYDKVGRGMILVFYEGIRRLLIKKGLATKEEINQSVKEVYQEQIAKFK